MQMILCQEKYNRKKKKSGASGDHRVEIGIFISLSALVCSALLFHKISLFKLTEQYQYCESPCVGSARLLVNPVSHIIRSF